MYHLSVITPEEVAFDGDVINLIAPGAAGYLEVLSNHAALITSLKTGTLTIKDKAGQRKAWTVTGGILEVLKNQAVILADDLMEI